MYSTQPQKRRPCRRTPYALAFLLALTACCEHRPTTILVVRHAEKLTNAGGDPHLSADGLARAEALARAADVARVDVVYVTQYQRTRETAQPLIAKYAPPVVSLPIDLAKPAPHAIALAKSIVDKESGKVVLVVSHSNTVPAIVNALAGVTVPPIGDNEYDRLYVITLREGVRPTVIVARFGAPSR